MNSISDAFLKDLQALQNPEHAKALSRFFKTEKGGYGEGDIFWGIQVPVQRTISRKYYRQMPLSELPLLISHPVHEVRLCTLMLMVYRYEKSKDTAEQAQLAKVYLDNLKWVNNWDLVDASAPNIIGAWFYERDRKDLYQMATSDHLWTQRVAMLASYYFIKRKDFGTALEIATLLLHHKHDLIHKAVGWMLREIGNRDYQTEYNFLLMHYKTMPRTMLRYAIEKFDEEIRQGFLKGSI